MADWSDKIGGAFKSFNMIGAWDSSIKNRGLSKPDHSLKLSSEGSSTKCSSAGGSSDSSKSNSEMILEGGSTNICVCWGGNLYIGADTRVCTQEAKSIANPRPEIKISREDCVKVCPIGHAIATMCGDWEECEQIWSKMEDYVGANPQEKSVHSIAYAGYESIMKVNPGDSVMFIAAVENGKAIAFRLDNDDIGDAYHRKRLSSVKETVNAVGTGAYYALKELSGKDFSKMSKKEAIECIQKALLVAAFADTWTGGELTVVYWDDGQQDFFVTSLWTIEAYKKFFNDLPFEKSCALLILYDEHTVKDSNIQSIQNVTDHGAIIAQSTCGLMVRRIAFKNGKCKRQFFARATHNWSFPECFLKKGKLEGQYQCLEQARIMRIQRKLIFVVKPSDQFLSKLETRSITSPTNFPMKFFSKYCKHH